MTGNIKKFFRGFGYAWQGIVYAVRTQINFRFHIVAALWVTVISKFYELSKAEYAVLFITIALVISMELINTAVEKAVDLITDKKSELAKAAKDTAAGAVLISAAGAVIVAVCLFGDLSGIVNAWNHLLVNPIAMVSVLVLAVASFIFVYKGI